MGEESNFYNPLKLLSSYKDNENKKYILEQYDDGTFGYKEINNLNNERNIVSQQNQNESREDYISRCGITFKNNQYGSNEKFDRMLNYNLIEYNRQLIKQNYGLDKFMKLNDSYIFQLIAEQGKYLNILINHKSKWVRNAVASHGYGIDILINDNNQSVSSTCEKWLKDNNISLDEYNKNKNYYYQIEIK